MRVFDSARTKLSQNESFKQLNELGRDVILSGGLYEQIIGSSLGVAPDLIAAVLQSASKNY